MQPSAITKTPSHPTTPAPGTASAAGWPRSARTLRDLALIQRIRDHQDEKAYAELLGHYHRPMQRFVRRRLHRPAETNDLTLEIFARAFRYLGSFRGEYAFSTWLFRVAANHCIDYVRRRELPTTSLQAAVGHGTGEWTPLEVADAAPSPHELLVKDQRACRLRQAVAQLPSTYQRAIHLFYFEELSYNEVATALQVPLGTVKARLFHGRARLQRVLRADAL